MVRRILSLRALFKKLSCMFCAGFSILAPKPSRASKTVLKNGFCIVPRFMGAMNAECSPCGSSSYDCGNMLRFVAGILLAPALFAAGRDLVVVDTDSGLFGDCLLYTSPSPRDG